VAGEETAPENRLQDPVSMTSINISEDIYFGYREEADRRGYRKTNGSVDTARFINEKLRENMEKIQKEIIA
jgi:hypothetical protein